MSGSVDDEVVRMHFDNSAFSRGVSTTLGLLSKLKSSLSFSGADKGLDNIENKAKKLDLSGMNKQIDESTHHWSAWRTAGLIAFATIVHRAVSAGINVVKAFTVDPIAAGFKNYETQINAVQTILANTGLKGKKGLGQVNSALSDLNTYANQTVYNFSEMAKNIGTFTAAGVKLKPATNAIKGIANLAALSGSTSDQASTAMYQLSQAIAANKVGLQDWNSVVNAGMGGKIFQKALFNTGKLDKTLKGVKPSETFDQWTKAGNSFRTSLQKGWITGKVLTQTLSQFTGDLTDAQLKAQGYNKTQIKQIQELAKTAEGAATHIKTMSQLTDALKEEVATAFGAIFKTIFGDINGATKLFSGIHTVVENALTVPIYSLNTMLQKVSALGGRAKAIDAFKNVFKALGAVLKPIKAAFNQIFPPKTAQDIANMIKKFDDFTKRLLVSADTASKIKRTFAGVFAVFDIAKQVIGGLVHVVIDLFKSFSPGAGSGLLGITANLGDMVVNFDKALKKGGALSDFFKHLGSILSTPLAIIKDLVKGIAGMFTGFKASDAKGVTSALDKVNDKLAKVEHSTDKIKTFFAGLSDKMKPAIQAIVDAFKGLGDAIARGLNSQTFSSVLKAVQVGLLGGLVLLFKKFLSKGINVDIGGGILGSAKEALEGVTGSLKAMQTQLKAKALLEIAAAMGILTLSIVGIATVDPKKLGSALQAMAVGFGELLASMAILTKISGAAGFVKIPLMAASLDLLAAAILILAAAVKLLASMSWDELKKGLTAVGALLAEVTAAALVISRNSGSMLSAGLGITAMAVAINILALAVKQFAKLSWKDMLKGLAGVAGALIAIALGMRLMPTRSMLATGAALIEIALAINAIYFAVKSFSSLSWKDLAKGLAGVAGSLVAIALAMHLMPKGMIVEAAGLALVAGSLMLIEKVMVSMAKLSWGTIAKGLGVIAISLGILAAAMMVMEGALPGAAALAIAAASLRLLLPVIIKLGQQSWGDIAKGLVTLAGALVILLAAGLAAIPIAPGLLVLGAAALALGGGLALAGVGVGALAAGLSLLATTGSAGIAVLIGAVTAVIEKIPQIALAFANGLVQVLLVIGKNGPTIVKAFGTILSSILTVIINNAPQLAKAIETLLEKFLAVVTKEAPKIIAAGLGLLIDLLSGIKNNIGRVVTTVTSIIVNFLNALSKNLPRIINAGVNLLEKLLIGIASALGRMPAIGIKVVVAFVKSLVGNYGKILSTGAAMLGKVVSGIGGAIGRVATEAGHVVSNFVSGLGRGAASLIKAGATVTSHILTGIARGIADVARIAAEDALDIGEGLVRGIINGLGGIVSSLISKLTSGISSAVHSVTKHIPFIGGPACMIGEPIMNEIARGIGENTKTVSDSLKTNVADALKTTTKTIGRIPIPIDADLNPTVTPVLDLSNIRKDAPKISGIVSANPITATTSFTSAASISAEQRAASEAAEAATTAAATATTIQFTQTNTSPKALSTIDIYRNTNNQLSQARSALNLPVPSTTS